MNRAPLSFPKLGYFPQYGEPRIRRGGFHSLRNHVAMQPLPSPTPDPLPQQDDSSSPFPPGLDEGITLALLAEEEGRSPELLGWLSQHPELAMELAQFLAAQNGLRRATTPDPSPLLSASGANFPHHPGSLELGEEIGRGGMGVVYRAYDRALRRNVAVKRVHTGPLTSPDDLARFRFEAEAVAGMNHPAVVPIHSFGEMDGQPFLVMPLMEGGSLAQRLHNLGPDRCLKPHEAAKLIRDVALGVHHAHQRGLLHRDLKPGNILLDSDGQPHVADFGLAVTLGSSFSLSLGGSIAGTAAYMSPEQVTGEKGLTTSVDIHALGAILYETLAGAPPFGRDDWLSTIQRVRDESPSPLRAKRTDIPHDLETICLRCLEKIPADRYPSAMSLAEDLTRFLDGEPLETRRSGWLLRVSRAVGRRRETLAMSTWPACFGGAMVLFFTHGTIQAIVLSGISGWWSYGILGLNFVSWLGLFVWFLMVRSHLLSPVERLSTALQIGTMMAAAALIPTHVATHGENILPLYPPLTAVLALGLFAHGATHWGALYLAGTALLGLSASFILFPAAYWPTLHGLAFGGALIWIGFRLWAFDRDSRHTERD